MALSSSTIIILLYVEFNIFKEPVDCFQFLAVLASVYEIIFFELSLLGAFEDVSVVEPPAWISKQHECEKYIFFTFFLPSTFSHLSDIRI